MTINNTPMQITTTYGLTKRTVTVEFGHVYVVAPLDPRMTKDRNRPCQVLAIDPSVEPLCTTVATVRFLDTNRKGRSAWRPASTFSILCPQPPSTARPPHISGVIFVIAHWFARSIE